MSAATVQGTWDSRFGGVGQVLAESIESGADVGASVAITLEGEMVVDIWGGHLDLERTRSWRGDTLINVWSCTKTVLALCILMLIEAGEVELHAPLSSYWPEFAKAGKGDITVAQVLGHTSGLSGWEKRIEAQVLYDWNEAASLLAEQEPWWEPGTASGYHMLTQGYLLGEVLRRVTGQTVGEFFAAELAGPLGADFYIGLPESVDHRVAEVIPPPPLLESEIPERGTIAFKTAVNPRMDATVSWSEEWKRAEIPAANGHGNARSLAEVQAVLACGGELHGQRFLSEKTCDLVFEEQARGVDLVLGTPIWRGAGYALVGEEAPLSASPKACFWGGWGGSIILVDVANRMTIAYVMNRMRQQDMRAAKVIFAANEAIGL